MMKRLNKNPSFLPFPRPSQHTDDDRGTGIEVEDLSSGQKLTEPFDSTLIRLTTQPMTIDSLLRRIKEETLELSPESRQQAGIWTDEAQSRLIESLLIRLPLPAFYIDATDEDHWLVIDGLQRLTALKRFVIENSLSLCGLEFLSRFDHYTYKELPAKFKRRIRETQIMVSKIEPGTPFHLKFNIFKRLNTGGLPLSAQEIRHVLYQGQATAFLTRLAQSEAFLEATAHAISDTRMAAQELVLRFYAFTLTPASIYKAQDFNGFLNDAMAHLNQIDTVPLTELEEQFRRTMQAAEQLFGHDAFRKRYDKQHRSYPINKALFEAWSVNLNQLSDEQLQTLKARKEALTNKFIELMNQCNFNHAISQGTAEANNVRIRFEGIKGIIQEVIS